MTTRTNGITREITEADGVKVALPRLLYEKDIYGDFLVRVHEKDRTAIPQLYLFLAKHGFDVLDKKYEFATMGRVKIPRHLEAKLRKKFRLHEIKE